MRLSFADLPMVRFVHDFGSLGAAGSALAEEFGVATWLANAYGTEANPGPSPMLGWEDPAGCDWVRPELGIVYSPNEPKNLELLGIIAEETRACWKWVLGVWDVLSIAGGRIGCLRDLAEEHQPDSDEYDFRDEVERLRYVADWCDNVLARSGRSRTMPFRTSSPGWRSTVRNC